MHILKYSQKSLSCLIVTILISGCATTNNSPDNYDPKIFGSSQKGIAILRVTQYAPQTLNKTDIGLSYNLKKIGEDKTYKKLARIKPIL